MEDENSNNFNPTDYAHEAGYRFPSAQKAIDALRQLARPPVTLGDEKSDVALAALAILGQAMLSPAKLSESVTLIKTNWDPWIGPWVKFFLNLAEQESFTPPYPLIVDKILYVIPLVVTYPTRCDETRESEIKHLAQIVPYLPPSATKFWLKLLRVMHWSLGHWGRLLTTMLDSGRHKGLLDEAYRRHPDELKEVAKSFIKFINAFNQRIQARQADEKHFHWNSGMLHCILASVVSSALHSSFVASGGMKALLIFSAPLFDAQYSTL
uniref:Uncharacterized protein n=1 Tax=Moniliophthora roreri TaxID=221103 RepID=A0A0W0FVV0_MONRR